MIAAADQTDRDRGAKNRATLKWLGLIAVAAFYLVIVPAYFADQRYVLRVITTASVLSLISLGVWLTFTIGRINIGQGAFALIGGYTTAILATKLGMSFWLSLPLSGLVAGIVGIVLGLGVLRLKGVYFAMITISLTEAVRLGFLSGGEFTGGAVGIPRIPLPDEIALFGVTLIPDFGEVDSHIAFYYLGAFLLIGGLAIIWRISTSRLGWIFKSLQQDEDLSASVGIHVAKYRIMAYGICCFYGGIGGSFFAVSQQSIYPSVFGVPDSLFFILYCFLGGLAYAAGPIVGAFVLFIMFEVLHELQEYQSLFYAMLMISIMLWLPNGILSLRLPRIPGRSADTGN